MRYKKIILKSEDADLSKMTIPEIEAKVRLWSNEMAQCKLFLFSNPGNPKLKHRHDYANKCILQATQEIGRRNVKGMRKLKSK